MLAYKDVNTVYYSCLLTKKYDIICHKDHKNELYLMVLYTQGYMHPFKLKIRVSVIKCIQFQS